MDEKRIRDALSEGGSVRAAAKLLNKSYTAVQWWIARNGYEVKKVAILVPRKPASKKEKLGVTA